MDSQVSYCTTFRLGGVGVEWSGVDPINPIESRVWVPAWPVYCILTQNGTVRYGMLCCCFLLLGARLNFLNSRISFCVLSPSALVWQCPAPKSRAEWALTGTAPCRSCCHTHHGCIFVFQPRKSEKETYKKRVRSKRTHASHNSTARQPSGSVFWSFTHCS